MDKNEMQDFIAKRVALELTDNSVVNLGIGLPTRVANFIPPDITVHFQSENGFIGLGPEPSPENTDPDIVNAGGRPVTILPGGAFFDSSVSFGIIRGGHVDLTVLGALQVDAKGNIASYLIPGKFVPGMGGAMDLLSGAKKVIIAMEHTVKGAPKILKECNLPLTAQGVVKLIITEMAVMEVRKEGIVLLEVNPTFTVDEVRAVTDAELLITGEPGVMRQ